ncbi:MAG TPA: fibronectin type III domain-containing protein [Chitinivibrionales bacterium]|nr:fibronectin type III domain-containing protein [Chitinivibrionales bacterium]
MKKTTIFWVMLSGFLAQFFCSPTSTQNPPGRVASISVSDSMTLPFPSLTFSASPGAQSYVIERRCISDRVYDSIGSATDAGFVDFDTSLLPETTYFYKVKARNVIGESAFSDSVSVLTPMYMILSPRQGDVFKINDTMRVLIKTADPSAVGGIEFGEGLNQFSPPGIAGTFHMYPSQVLTFAVPATFLPFGSAVPMSTVSDSCYILIFDYATLDTYARSYGYFQVTN